MTAPGGNSIVRHVALMEGALPLAAWYGQPMSPAEAADLLREAHQRLQRSHARGRACFACGLQALIARYWLGRDVEGDYRTLMATAPGERELALADLVYGQLLMSRKRADAMTHLNDGFARAVHELGAREYFEVLHRHELLAYLPPMATGTVPPQGLDALLAEAGVIRRLQGERATQGTAGADRDDTVG
ncbi:MAG TPA: hypothetical protein VKA76_03360 [Gammaproteobacteria bacterium]|nr:hypothetical protein [Gammaproteobacteria bacterium]